MHEGKKIFRDWDDLRVFLAVSRCGSFTEAARQLRLVQSTVGRRMANLEHQVGAKLFQRHRDGMRLTERGAELANRAALMETTAREIERHIMGADQEMSGTVRITVTDGLAAFWLVPRMQLVHAAQPSIHVELLTSTSWGLVSSADADIAIRYAPPAVPQIVGRKVGITRFALFASKKYLESHGAPRTLDELREHAILDNSNLHSNSALSDWHELLSRTTPVLTANSTAVVCAAREDVGVALLPTFYRLVASELVRLDIPFNPTCDIWLWSHTATNKSARVRAVLAYLGKQFAHDRAQWFS